MPNLASANNGAVVVPSVTVFPVETIAAAGSVIGNAVAIGSNVGVSIVTGADDAKGAILPTAQPGKVICVYNNTATKGLPVYPPVNGTLNDGSANAALTLEGKTLAIFVATNSVNWAASYVANS